jgi:signal transduction histidine kinase
VIDAGPGIPTEELPYVFNRFWRADKSRSRDQGGSGLGLAIAQQLIKAHHGQVGVESQPGQGSRFWFSLPQAAVAGKPA